MLLFIIYVIVIIIFSIGCNQACLDHIFVHKRCSCLVNPVAGYETSLLFPPVEAGKKKKIAVVGAGPAGLAFSITASKRGHAVTLFEKESVIGGQFNLAKLIPGKEEFFETLRYYGVQLKKTGVDLRLNTEASASDLADFDSVVLASGVVPRQVRIPNNSKQIKMLSYLDVLKHGAEVGRRVAVIGAGGIGFDIADFLTHDHPKRDGASVHGPEPHIDKNAVASFLNSWGVDTKVTRGGLLPRQKSEVCADEKELGERKVFLLQRKTGKLGASLGKTTGWIHRTTMKKRGVEELDGCKYIEINDSGLVIEVKGKRQTLNVDTVIICAGQESQSALFAPLSTNSSKKVFLIGGAQEAGELDAKRAIDQGMRLAAVVETANTGDVFEAYVGVMPTVIKTVEKYLSKK